LLVIPAKAGIQLFARDLKSWIPAFAGMKALFVGYAGIEPALSADPMMSDA